MIIEQAPLDLSFCFDGFDGLENRQALFYEPLFPVMHEKLQKSRPMIEQIEKQGDLLLCYPYHSMRPFIDLLEQAATDPDVISIKITLYRLASNSRIVNALVRAGAVINDKSVYRLAVFSL